MTMGKTVHTAELTDPLTGEKTTLRAATEAELDEQVSAHLARAYPGSDDGTAQEEA